MVGFTSARSLDPDDPRSTPYRLFGRSVRDWINGNGAPDSGDMPYFAHWARALFRSHTAQFFEITKRFLAGVSAHEVIADAAIRRSLLEFTMWLMQQRRHDDAIHLVQAFSDDPDPNNADEHHEAILRGDSPDRSSAVRCRLAWSVHQLCLNEETLSEAVRQTQKLLNSPNLSVKYQALTRLLLG